jgi:hypothetical protein
MYGRADGMPSFQLTMAVRAWFPSLLQYVVLSNDSRCVLERTDAPGSFSLEGAIRATRTQSTSVDISHLRNDNNITSFYR